MIPKLNVLKCSPSENPFYVVKSPKNQNKVQNDNEFRNIDFGLNLIQKFSFRGGTDEQGQLIKPSDIIHFQGENNFNSYWTYLNLYDSSRNEAIKDLQQKFKRKTKHVNTVVIEPCGLFFRIHNAAK